MRIRQLKVSDPSASAAPRGERAFSITLRASDLNGHMINAGKAITLDCISTEPQKVPTDTPGEGRGIDDSKDLGLFVVSGL